MTSENRAKGTPEPNFPTFDLNAQNIIPPVEFPKLEANDDDLNRWANERIAIYASLDAAMTKHIVEAISALSELKRRAEEEANFTSQQLIIQRDSLKRETEELRLEQLRLDDAVKESRRAYDEEQARRIALEHSSAAWLEQARLEREELQLEIRRLKVHLEEARQELQTFYRYRSELAESQGGFAAWIEKQAEVSTTPPRPEAIYRPAEIPAENITLPETPKPDWKPEMEELPPFMLPVDDAELAVPFQLEQDFGDVLTPRIPGGSPVIKTGSELSPITAHESPTKKPVDAGLLAGVAEVEEDQADLLAVFQDLSQPPVPPVEPELAPEPALAAPEEKPEAAPRLTERPPEKTRDRARRARTEQRVQHILGRRRPEVPQITPAADGGDMPGHDLLPEPELPEKVPAETLAMEALPLVGATVTTGRGKGSKRRPALSDDDKAAFKSLGQQLGLEAATPLPSEALKFAPGYTPPPRPTPVAQMMTELKANAKAMVPPPSVTPAPPPRSPFEPLSEDFVLEDEMGPMTLEELLEAGEQELAEINENPTPPEEPTPFIGNLSDEAIHFRTEHITSPGLIRADKFNEVPVNPEVEHKSTPRSRRAGGPIFPGFPLPPPPSSVKPGEDESNSLSTKLTVSNLQGRYSPLVMEKVVRGLEGVFHVIVTDFSKGVLVMDVRHQASLNLGEKLLSMTELRLKLVEAGPNALEFSQETS